MKSELWQRIREVRRRKNLTQQAVADWFGIDRGSVSQWESVNPDTRTTPDVERLMEISRRTGAPLESYLLNDEAPVDADWGPAEPGNGIRVFHPDDPAEDDEIRIPESRIKFSGGHGALAYETVLDSEPATYRLSWFQKERINPTRTMRFRVTGDSMEPLLWPNDSVLVNLDETAVRDGQVYVFRQDDELKVKMLVRREDKALVLRSVNRVRFPDEIIPAEELHERITIIGRVRDKSGRGGLSGWPTELQEPFIEYRGRQVPEGATQRRADLLHELDEGVKARFPHFSDARQAAVILKLYQWCRKNPHVTVDQALELITGVGEES